MSRAPIERAIGKLALMFGLRRALRAARGGPRLSFLSGVGVGAGLMYLIAGRVSPQPPRRTAPLRDPQSTPARKARAHAGRQPQAAARSKSPAR